VIVHVIVNDDKSYVYVVVYSENV